jgi:hypothetical protein
LVLRSWFRVGYRRPNSIMTSMSTMLAIMDEASGK